MPTLTLEELNGLALVQRFHTNIPILNEQTKIEIIVLRTLLLIIHEIMFTFKDGS